MPHLIPCASRPQRRLYARYLPGVTTDFELTVRRSPFPLARIKQEVGGWQWARRRWVGRTRLASRARSSLS